MAVDEHQPTARQPLKDELRQRVTEAIGVVERAERKAQGRDSENVRWLYATLKFTLLLDAVSKAIEPVYRLYERWQLGTADASEVRQCRAALKAAPIRELFETYASRARSRGSLGVLSSMNQRLWQQYRDLDRFLATLEKQ